MGDAVSSFLASYTYFADDRLASVTYGNGASAAHTYDAARRMTSIEHRNGVGQVMLRMSYTFDARDLPIEVVESDAIGQVAATTYTYDTRGRLVKEDRIGANPYAMVYEYDQGGNRTQKTDAIREIEVDYYYDVDDPASVERFSSRANRLMYYETFDAPPDASRVLVSTTWYYYNESGNVTRVVTSDAGSNTYTATRLGYAKNGQTVMYLLNEQWTWDGLYTSCPTAYVATNGREFKYDGARQRYLDHAFNVEANGSFTTTEETWTDYDGDNAYGDYTIDGSGGGAITNIRSFEPGIGRVDPWQSSGGGSTSYTHADQIGSRRRTSNAGGTESSATLYTAFGEPISGEPVTTATRHAYAGAHGYQSHSDFPFLHVGHRYYDPTTGRFLQRDPIGIFGGLNVYEYVRSTPLIWVDPSGLDWLDDVEVAAAKAFIWGTGGRDSWLDDKKKVKRAQRKLQGFAAGILITCVAPVAAPWGAFGWGGYRTFGGSSGSSAIDDYLDGAAFGSGAATLPRLPGIGGPPSGMLRPPPGFRL